MVLTQEAFKPGNKSLLRKKYSIPENVFIIGGAANAGTLKNPWKGGDYTLQALEKIFDAIPNSVFLNIGSGNTSQSNRIFNIPPVKDESSLAEIYSLMDVLLVTSVADNAPLVVIEALACGLPVVSFNTGGIPEMVINGKTGIISEYKNSSNIAEAVIKLAADKILLEKFGNEARTDMLKRYDLKNINDQYLNLYGDVLSQKPAEKKYFSISEVPREITTERFINVYNEIFGQKIQLQKPLDLGNEKTNTADIGFNFIRSNKFGKISIVTPSFNQAQFLEETIDSILSQNYPNLEYIIMDGGSNDGSVEIIKKYEKYLSYWQSKPDGGQYRAIEDGLNRSTGEILAWLNSDDKLQPNSLFKVANLFKEYPHIEWICGRPTYLNSSGDIIAIHPSMPVWNRDKFLQKKYDDPFIQQESTFWKRSLWNKAGGYLSPKFDLAADLELWIRYFRFTNLYSFDALLGAWRRHDDQKSSTQRQKYISEAEEIIENEIKKFSGIEKKNNQNSSLIIKYDATSLINDGLDFSIKRSEKCWCNYELSLIRIANIAISSNNLSILELLKSEFVIDTPKYKKISPPISVITPSYNQAQYIEQTIQSVLSQNYPNFEHIVVDGGSTDGTIDILKKYPHLKWISEKDNGQADALNKGFKKASGDIIAWINSDDWYEPDTFSAVAVYFENNPDENIVMGDCNLVDENGNIFDKVINGERGFEELKQYKVSRSIPTQPAVFFRRKLLEEKGLLDMSLFFAMDYDLWLRFALGNTFRHIDKTVANYRFHKDAKGGDQNWGKFIPEWEKVSKKYSRQTNNLVSVVIPCYNYGKYLSEAVESIINQTYKNFEIIIVNDGSTDDTKEIAEQLADKYKGKLIKVINQKNSGQPAISRNNGIKISAGEFILCLDADDKIAPEYLQKCVSILEKDSEISIVYTYRRDFDGVDRIVETGDYDFNILKNRNIISVASLFRKKAWADVGGYRTNVKGLEDWDLWIAMGARGYIGQLIREPLFCYRYHDNGLFQEAIKGEREKIARIIINNKEVYPDDTVKKAELFLTVKNQKSNDLGISIIIPTHNRKNKLQNAIRSVLIQTYQNYEVIVVNDAGEDVQNIIDEFTDHRIKLINHDHNKGLGAARNTGIKAASGKYIALLDDDDIFYENHLETAVKYLSDNFKAVYTDAVRCSYKTVKGKEILVNKSVPYSIDFNRDKLLIGNIAPVNCFVFEKSLAEKVGMFDEGLKVLEDWDLWLKLSSLTDFKHIKVNTVQVNWLDDGSTMTSSKAEDFDKSRKIIYKKYDGELKKINNANKIIEEFNAIWEKDFTEGLPLVSIIALSYNQPEYTKQFVESVLEFTKTPFELLLIDNGSNNETVDYIKSISESDKRIKTVFNKENLGFPKGINQGLKAAAGAYLLIANNDIVVTEGWLERMIEVAESDPKIGIVGPVSNAVSGVQLDKDANYSDIKTMHGYAKKIRKNNSGKTFEFPRVAFLCTLIKKDVVEKIGGLDEIFSPGNYEDDDFCLRAQIAGFKTIIAQDVFIHHYGSKSFTAEGTDKYKERLEINQKKFVDKWGGTPEEIWLKGKQIKGRNIMITLNKNEFVENLERALSLIEEKDYTAAVKYLDNSIATYDQNDHEENNIDLAYLLNLAGNISLLSNEIENARSYFEKALNEDNSSPLACSGLGDVLFVSGNYEGAKTMYEWSLKNDPNNKAASEGILKVNQKLNNSANQNTEIFPANQAVQNQKFDNAEILIEQAYEHFNKNEFQNALNKLITAERLFNGHLSNPSDKGFASSFHNMKGFIYLGLNDVDNARSCFEKALSIDPQSSQACAGLGETLYLTEHDEQSKAMFEWAVKNNPNNMVAVGGLQKVNKLLGYPENHSSLNSETESLMDIKINHRDEFGHLFNKLGLYGKGVEIGVQEGIFSKILRSTWKGEELYLIDRWKYESDYKDIANIPDEKQKEYYLSVVSKFADDRSVNIIRKDSVAAAKQFPDEYFDWIYLDADHSLKGCGNDLNAWYQKLKPGGIFAGHDYLDGEYTAGSFGVKSAVDNYAHHINAKLFITEETYCKSWYFVKPDNNIAENKTHSLPENENLSEADSQRLQSVLNEILESSFDLFGLKYFDEALDTLKKSEGAFYSQDSKELISAFENLRGFNYLGLDNKDLAKNSFEKALNINPLSSQACAGLGELFYLDGKDKEAKTMYEFSVKNNPDNQFAIGGLEKVNKILGLPEENNSLL